MSDSPQAAQTRPLVTFALFAYNQEDYIREAIEGAFSQTYEPLEIILSDDCSSDRTFAIMQEMAAAYDGPHHVVAVQTDQNLGVVPHVMLRGKEARGEIVVVAAGDDISLPYRVETHVRQYIDPSVWGVSGGFDLIDSNGSIISSGETTPVGVSSKRLPKSYILNIEYPYIVIQGSTASYRNKVFQFPVPSWKIEFAEDNFFNFLIYLNGGRVAFIDEPLIKYRVHNKALNNKGIYKKDILISEKETLSSARRSYNKMLTYKWISNNYKDILSPDIKLIESQLNNSFEMINWDNKSYISRIISIIKDIKSGNISISKWKIFRIIGKCPNYYPKLFLSRFQSRYQ